MKSLLSLLAATAVLSLATGCVSVKHEEPASTTRTTTVAPAAVSTSTTTY